MCAMPRLTFRRALRFLVFAIVGLRYPVFGVYPSAHWYGVGFGAGSWPNAGLPHLLDALLARDRLPRPLPGPGVRLRPLAADRQAFAVPYPSVAVDVPQPADVLLHRPPQLPL